MQAHERRAHRGAGDPLAGGLDLGELDHSSTSVPIPWLRATATACSAAARSSTARPERAKQRQLGVVAATGLQAREHLAELGADVLLARRSRPR